LSGGGGGTWGPWGGGQTGLGGGGGGGEVNKILFRVLKSEPAHAEGTTFVV